MIEVGSSIGRYHITEKLGEGGMANVYRAYDTRLERDVAIKVIRVDAFPPAGLERVLKRFEREARSLARLAHTNIVKIFDFGDYNGAPYLVMEFVAGGTLKKYTGQRMPWQKAAALLIPIAGALDYAHQKGVIHRDVKPANILFNEADQPMLSDFGIAHLLEEGSEGTLTTPGVGIGTPEYMAPEQGMGLAIDGRADVYSLGIVFYELITGRKPYTADTPMAIVYKHLTDPLPPPTKYAPDLPEAVEKFIFKALAKQPEDRFESMRAFAEALSALAANPSPAVSVTMTEVGPQPPEKLQMPAARPYEETFAVAAETPPPAQAAEPGELSRPFPRRQPYDVRLIWQAVTSKIRPLWMGLAILGIGVLVAALLILRAAQRSAISAGVYPAGEIPMLYLTSNRDGSRQIYYQNPVDGRLVRLSNISGGECFTPVAIKEGLLYATCIQNGKMDIFSSDVNGANFQRITRAEGGGCWEPAIGPNYNLYFTCDREGKREIYTQDSQSGLVRRVTDSSRGESWDPALGLDGELYFTSNRDGSLQVYRQSNATGAVTRVTDPKKGTCWSPQLGASGILYLTCRRNASVQVYAMNYGTGELFPVTDAARGENWGLIPGPKGILYFTSNRDGKMEVYSMDRQTGVVTRVTNSPGKTESWTKED